MKKTLLTLCGGLLSLFATAQTTLYDTPFSATYNNATRQMPYRIPAIVETENATTGAKELLYFGDKRYCGMDIGWGSSTNAFVVNGTDYYRIDIMSRRSTDGGSTWGSETTVKQGTASCGYGDAAVVSNHENPKEIVFFAATGNVRYGESTYYNPLKTTRFYSNDGGLNWSSTDMTSAVYSKIYNVFSGVTGLFFTSGRICQSKQIKVGDYYRIYSALCVYNGSTSNAFVVYSDDFGASWNVLGSGYAVSGGDESAVEELPNGNVLISSRIYSGYDSNGRRRFNVFKYNSLPTSANTASGSWGTVYSGIQYTGTTKPCNGELLLVPAKDASGNTCNILLHSEPYGTTEAEGRGNVSIFWKKLSSDEITTASEFEGTSWNRYSVSTTTSAYSTMILKSDGDIAFAYEETIWGNGTGAPSVSIDKITWGEHGYDLKYQTLSLSTITGGTYSYYKETATVETVATPTFSVTGGEVSYGSQVTLSCSTSDATIYYTTDGTTPSATNGTVYTGAITITEAMTLQAVAVKTGYNASAVASATYTIKTVTEGGDGEEGGNEGTGGDDNTATTVTKYRFKNVHADGTIFYFAYDATNGLTLTSDVNYAYLYTRTTVDETNGVYNFQSEDGNYLIFTGRGLSSNKGYNDALGYYPSYNSTYCDLTVSKMVFGGNVTSEFSGTYYTIKGTRLLDGSNAEVYFVIKKSGPAFDGANSPYYNDSYSSAFVIEEVEVAVENETPVVETAATPVISVASGEVTSGTQVEITCATEDATIYYTTDGTTPSATNGTEYTGAITITEAMTLSAVAVKDGCNDSEVATANYTIKVVETVERVETPVISPNGGRVNAGTDIYITCSTVGASIYYTLDGSEPSAENGTLYYGPITIYKDFVLRCIAVCDGYKDSFPVLASFTVSNVIDWDMTNTGCDNCVYTISSLYLDYAVSIPAGVKAYRAVYNASRGTVTLYRLRNGFIPAEYPVVLKDTYARESITLNKSNYSYNPGTNELAGTLVDLPVDDATNYYLYCHSENKHIGFFNPTEDVIPAYSAYLPRPAGASEIKVRFDDEDEDATGIEDILFEEDDDAPVYDLKGRRVTDYSKPGIYIKKGKKFIVR